MHTIAAEELAPWPEITPIGDYLYDPDATIVRGGLVGHLARECGLTAVDARVAWLTGPLVASPFLICYRVDAVVPLDVKHVAARLREYDVGRITIVKRGIDVDADRMLAKWTSERPGHRFVLLTRVNGERRAIIADRIES